VAVHVIDDSGSTVVSDESVESHSGAFVTASRSSRSCCNSTSPTRGIDVSVGTSVDSVDEATVDEVDEVDEARVDEVDEATVDEVDEATVDEVEVLVDVVVAG
jgi:flavin-binding protein dodecin